MPLVVIATHPVQYLAPLYRTLAREYKLALHVIYDSNYSALPHRDKEFRTDFAWDTDLLSGYDHTFLHNAGGAPGSGSGKTHGLGKTLRRLSPEAVLISGYSPFFYQAAILSVLNAGYPMIFRAETTDHAQNRNAFKNLLRDWFLRKFYAQCRYLLYVGAHSYRHFKRLGCPEEKLLFSPYSVDTSYFKMDERAREEFRRATREKLGITESQIVVLFSGKLSARKAPELLIRSVKELEPGLRRKIVLLYMGDGQLLDSLKNLAQKDQVPALFIGFKNQSELSPYFHCADLLSLPSRSQETWGLVVNEALHHGLPVIASDAVGSAVDLIEPGITGEVFEKNSIASLAAALGRGIALCGQETTRNSCRNKAAQYDMRHAAEGIARAYQAIIKNGPGKTP